MNETIYQQLWNGKSSGKSNVEVNHINNPENEGWIDASSVYHFNSSKLYARFKKQWLIENNKLAREDYKNNKAKVQSFGNFSNGWVTGQTPAFSGTIPYRNAKTKQVYGLETYGVCDPEPEYCCCIEETDEVVYDFKAMEVENREQLVNSLEKVDSMPSASFYWGRSLQGFNYWNNIRSNGHTPESTAYINDMIRQWDIENGLQCAKETVRVGDEVIGIKDYSNQFSVNTAYQVKSAGSGRIDVEVDDKGSTSNGIGCEFFRFAKPDEIANNKLAEQPEKEEIVKEETPEIQGQSLAFCKAVWEESDTSIQYWDQVYLAWQMKTLEVFQQSIQYRVKPEWIKENNAKVKAEYEKLDTEYVEVLLPEWKSGGWAELHLPSINLEDSVYRIRECDKIAKVETQTETQIVKPDQEIKTTILQVFNFLDVKSSKNIDLEVDTSHGISIGDKVKISNCIDSDFDNIWLKTSEPVSISGVKLAKYRNPANILEIKKNEEIPVDTSDQITKIEEIEVTNPVEESQMDILSIIATDPKTKEFRYITCPNMPRDLVEGDVVYTSEYVRGKSRFNFLEYSIINPDHIVSFIKKDGEEVMNLSKALGLTKSVGGFGYKILKHQSKYWIGDFCSKTWSATKWSMKKARYVVWIGALAYGGYQVYTNYDSTVDRVNGIYESLPQLQSPLNWGESKEV